MKIEIGDNLKFILFVIIMVLALGIAAFLDGCTTPKPVQSDPVHEWIIKDTIKLKKL